MWNCPEASERDRDEGSTPLASEHEEHGCARKRVKQTGVGTKCVDGPSPRRHPTSASMLKCEVTGKLMAVPTGDDPLEPSVTNGMTSMAEDFACGATADASWARAGDAVIASAGTIRIRLLNVNALHL